MSSPSKRREMDLMKLMMSDYKVEMINDGMQEFYVDFHGPNDSPYHGGVWRIRVELPDAYPYKSPSIGFMNKIYHPNVDEMSGSVCLDVINQTWSPMFDLVNVFEVFLPQLLLYPNPSDPLNGEAAALMMRDRTAYEQRVKGFQSLALLVGTISNWIACRNLLYPTIQLNLRFLLSVSENGQGCIELEKLLLVTWSLLLLTHANGPEYCEKYAKPEDCGAAAEEKSSDEEMSEDDYASSDEAVAGQADP
ncbi:hypothetical protein HHK36_027682 [Tetracentron sinense]|uniref:E2 ubiquitin-conjugating enzyme n=1 Tax=Tetracentron sinense TaxID=13715 RepID=A0A835D1S3_TETSI|nr:hypothetical protein HHK36_027682 [Tetracentron sinense]